MTDDKLRRRIIVEAAQLIRQRKESAVGKARMRAARQLVKGFVRKAQMPSDVEIRDEIVKQTYLVEGDVRFDNLRSQRVAALNVMRQFAQYAPRIKGSIVAGNVRSTGFIEIFFDRDDEVAVMQLIETQLFDDSAAEVEIEFVDSPDACGVSLQEFEEIVSHDYPDIDMDVEEIELDHPVDRFELFRMLLFPLSQVQQKKSSHPEGDVLYHSLQVFELARDELSYDEEFLLAALLHDVGKAIDKENSVQAGLNALGHFVTERTIWFIENLPDARKILDNSLGGRARKRLNQHPDYEELLLLARCDRKGRVPGGLAPDLDEAIEYIRDLARMYG